MMNLNLTKQKWVEILNILKVPNTNSVDRKKRIHAEYEIYRKINNLRLKEAEEIILITRWRDEYST